MQIRSVGVVGCGLMGSGIAQVAAAAGYATIVREVDEPLLQRGLGRIRQFLDDSVTKGKVPAEVREKTLANLTGTVLLADLAPCELVIEAIIENREQKTATYAALERVLSPPAIVVSNTSSLCITELAA